MNEAKQLLKVASVMEVDRILAVKKADGLSAPAHR